MKTRTNKLSKTIFLTLLSFSFAFLGGILLYGYYIEPFLPEEKKLLADPWLIMGFFMGACIGFALFIPINMFSRLFRDQDLTEKSMFVFVFVFGVAGFFANIAVYQYVIKPKEMIICPREFGYKKNLMRFYVTDLSLCKSD